MSAVNTIEEPLSTAADTAASRTPLEVFISFANSVRIVAVVAPTPGTLPRYTKPLIITLTSSPPLRVPLAIKVNLSDCLIFESPPTILLLNSETGV